MAAPAAVSLAVRVAVAAATDKRTWKGLAVLTAAVLTPFILVFLVLFSLSGYNDAAVQGSFRGEIPAQAPADYRQHMQNLQQHFKGLEAAVISLSSQLEGGSLDVLQIKAIYYTLLFGSPDVDRVEDQAFVEQFVRWEERTRTVKNEDGEEIGESYTVAVPIPSLPAIYVKVAALLGRPITEEEQVNAAEIEHRARYGTGMPEEGDAFEQWEQWMPPVSFDPGSELPAGETGAEAVRLALTRLGDPYSQERRGQGNYTDCSYLTLWVYRKLGVRLPATAAAQAEYLVEKGLTVSKTRLAPGDLVFWSHKPNGRYRNITHVGIYAGEGKVVDASSSKGQVVYRNLFEADKQVLHGRPAALANKE